MNSLFKEHAQLLLSAERLNVHLSQIRGRYSQREVSHLQHEVFADRALSLSQYLSGALDLVVAERYGAAFAILRTALEHWVFDMLLLLGKRYSQLVRNVSDEKWEEWQQARAAGVPWTSDIIDWHRGKSTVRIIRSGLHADGQRGPRAQTLSIYYFLLEDFDPIAGHPSRQGFLTNGFSDPDLFVRLAQRSRETYHQLVGWSALKDNLRINNLFRIRDLAHLDVHYTFLSAFVHPVSSYAAEVYDRDWSGRSPKYDHYSSELCLLYAVQIAASELVAFEQMAGRQPKVELIRWEEIRFDVDRALLLSAHLWFPPSGKPHMFDRIEESNRRFALEKKRGRGTVVDPNTLAERAIKYYRDPLRRLIRMHVSSTELLTGLTYRSPWERADAQRRA